jgi:chorismate mutase
MTDCEIKMVDTIDLIKMKILAKWISDIMDEIANNKELSNQDIIEMLMTIKSTVDEIDKIIAIIVRENTTSQKS